jgi:hypothetical protein
MKYGNLAAGADTVTLPANTISLFDVGPALTTPAIVGSLILYLDGQGGGADQVLRPLVMAADDPGSLVLGDEITIAAGAAPAWRHLTFDMPPRLPIGDVLLGIASGPAGGTARIHGALGHAGISQRYTSPYAGPPDLSGSDTDLGLLASAVMLAVTPWTAPDNLTDDAIADLPIDVASAIFRVGGPVSAATNAVCGWYYSVDNPPPPAAAVAREDGPLSDLVGQRILVTTRTSSGFASIAVYVADEQPFDDDLASQDLWISREAFARIGDFWADSIDVTIAVLA